MHIDTMTYETLKFRDVSGRMQPNVGYSIAYNIFKRTEDMTQTSPTSGHIYSTAGFHITLSRDISYSVVNTFLPSLLIVLTSFIRGATIHLYTRSVSLQSTKPTHHPTPKPRPQIHVLLFKIPACFSFQNNIVNLASLQLLDPPISCTWETGNFDDLLLDPDQHDIERPNILPACVYSTGCLVRNSHIHDFLVCIFGIHQIQPLA
jgi:hypothetical protein